jgi:hypothetical protein
MARTFPYDRAARALAEAAVFGDATATERHGISLRTLQRWREQLGNDDKLAQCVAEKRRSLDEQWAEDLVPAIRASIDFIKRAAQEATLADPNMVHSIVGGFKILTDVAIAQKILDERLARQRGPVDAVRGPVASGGEEPGSER